MRHLIRLLRKAPPCAHICLAALAALCVALLVLTCSLGESRETLLPMPAEAMAPAGGAAYFLPHPWSQLSIKDGGLWLEADPELLENGVPMYPTLGLASRVRDLGQGRYRFQDGGALFSASDNSDPRTNGRRYEMRCVRTPVEAWAGWYALAALGLATALGAAFFGRRGGLAERLRACGGATTAFVLLFPPLLGLALCLAYAACIAAGMAAGFAQPLAAPYLLFPAMRGVARMESYWPHLLLAWAGLGSLIGWICSRRGRGRSMVRAAEATLARLLRRLGVVLVVGLCLFSVGSVWGSAWLGIPRASDANYVTLGGMLPLNDGAYYFFDTQVQAETGKWHIFPVRRPVGCALRSAEALAAGYSLPGYQAVQAGLLALTVFFAALAAGRWRGTWTGVGFVGLLGVMARNFLAATNTEPAGLVWACLGLCLLAESLRRNDSRRHALSIFLFTVALMARPGPMLVLPAFLAWSWWRFRSQGPRRWLHMTAAVLALVLGLGFQQLVAVLYGEPKFIGTTSIWYFLSQDMTERQAFQKLNAEIGTDYSSPEWAEKLHKAGMAELKRNPRVLLRRIREGLDLAPKALPLALLNGYSSVKFPPALALALAPLLLLGLARALRRPGAGEPSLWALQLPAIAASAVAVYQYEGQRTFMAVYPLIWLFAAGGFCAPSRLTAAVSAACQKKGKEGTLALSLAAVLLVASVAAPAAAHRLWPRPPAASGDEAAQDSPRISRGLLTGGPGLCGILLVPDGEPVPKDVPAMPYGTFLRLSAGSASFFQTEFAMQPPPKPPVSIIIGHMPRHEMPERYNYIFTAPEVLQRRGVAYWDVTLLRRTQHSEASLATWQALRIIPAGQ